MDVPLTVVVPALHDSPTLVLLREELTSQLGRMGGELLVMDGSRTPGADVFALRAEGARLARGEFVAFTEDHCLPAEGWCDAIVRAFRSRPDAEVATGPISNGSTEGLMSWANFLLTFARSCPAPRRAPGNAHRPSPTPR
jgi:hypothetical protein